MLEKIKQLSLCKIGIYAIYLCLQILILAALILTTTNMIVHSILMCITILFYFVVSLKDPGVYVANPEPNLEDIDNKSEQKVKKHKKASNILSEKDNKSNHQQADIKQPIPEKQKDETCPQPPQKYKITKKISLEERVESAQVPSQQFNLHAEEAHKNKESKERDIKSQPKLQASAKNIITAAKTAIGNFAQMLSRKDLQVPPEQENNSKLMKRVNFNTNSQQKQVEKESEDKPQNIARQTKRPTKDVSISMASNRGQPPTSDIDRDQHHDHQINKQHQKPNIISNDLAKNSKDSQRQSCKTKLSKIKRYCSVCEYYQPLRVRHCHSCENCISTFDHHCPWLNNCIGQKNKHLFLIYLFLQTLQFFVIIIDLICLLSSSQGNFNHGSVGVLLLSAIIFFILLGGLLAFHLCLVANNITTWEMYRWNRIQYLSLFDQKELTSPFSKDCKQNFKLFWSVSRDDKRKQWSDQIRDDLQQFLVKPTKIPKEKEKERCQDIDTNRRLFRSMHNL